jgi:radical SAM superfamily enzyme YgiQ (UPF0313 family)
MKNFDMLMAYPKPTRDSPVKLTPLSILYPGAMFENEGKRVAYYDERFDSPELFDDLVRQSKEIGVSAFTGFQTGTAARLLKRAKNIDSKIITNVGGHHARILSDEVMAEPFVDKVWPNRVYGEEFFPYNERTKLQFKRTDMQYFTSRGCPFPCTFCALVSPWKPKPIEELDREMKIIHNDTGFKDVSFSDPNIGFGVWEGDDGKTIRIDRVKRIQDIGQVMKDIGAYWSGNIRSPYLSPEMIDALVEANCSQIEIGCESGNDYFLKKVIRKGHGIEHIKNAARNVRGSGISIMYSFISGMPRETEEMRRDTYDLIDWIKNTDPDSRISIYQYAPYPGSPMYDDAVNGVDGYPKFDPPKTMEEWGELKLMASPIYWITGLNFRLDNTRKNFPGDEWGLIDPYVKLAQKKWKERDFNNFPVDKVEFLINRQVEKHNLSSAELANVSV